MNFFHHSLDDNPPFERLPEYAYEAAEIAHHVPIQSFRSNGDRIPGDQSPYFDNFIYHPILHGDSFRGHQGFRESAGHHPPPLHYEEVGHHNNGGKIIAHRVGEGEEHFDEEIHENLPQMGAHVNNAPLHPLHASHHAIHIVHATPSYLNVALNPPKKTNKPALIKAELKKVAQAAGEINKAVQAKVGEANRLVAKITKTAAQEKQSSPVISANNELVENTEQTAATNVKVIEKAQQEAAAIETSGAQACVGDQVGDQAACGETIDPAASAQEVVKNEAASVGGDETVEPATAQGAAGNMVTATQAAAAGEGAELNKVNAAKAIDTVAGAEALVSTAKQAAATGDQEKVITTGNGDVVDDAVSVEQSTAENQQNSSCVEGTCRFTLNDTKEVVQHNNTNGESSGLITSEEFKKVINAFEVLNAPIPPALQIAELKAEVKEMNQKLTDEKDQVQKLKAVESLQLKSNKNIYPTHAPHYVQGVAKDKAPQREAPNGAAEVTKLIQKLGQHAIEADPVYTSRYQHLQQLNLHQQQLLKDMLVNTAKVMNNADKKLKKPDKEQYTVETILNLGHETDPGIQEAQLVSILRNMQRQAGEAMAGYWHRLQNRHPFAQPNANTWFAKEQTNDNRDHDTNIDAKSIMVKYVSKEPTETIAEKPSKKLTEVRNSTLPITTTPKVNQTKIIEDAYADLGSSGLELKAIAKSTKKKKRSDT